MRVVVFFHSGAWEAVHQGLSTAAAAASLGREVELYFFWWALERLARDRLDEVDLDGRDDVVGAIERRGVPSLRALLGAVRESGKATVFGCSGSLAAVGLTPPDLEGKVDQIVGWTTILQRTAGVTDRFFV